MPSFFKNEVLEERKPRRSQYMRGTLAQRYEDAVKDPGLDVLRDDLALVEGRLATLLERASAGEDSGRWDELRQYVKTAIRTVDESSLTDTKKVLSEMSRILEAVDQDYKVWDEILKLLDARSKIVEKETRRMTDMGQMISAEDAMKLVNTLLQSVRRHVTEPTIYKSIAYEFVIATGGARRVEPDRRIAEIQPGESDQVDSGKFLDT